MRSLLFLLAALAGGTLLGQVDFTGGLPAGWTADGITGVFDDGMADDIDPNWAGRDRIASASLGNAFAMTNVESGGAAVLRTPPLDFTGASEVWVTFHQYYRAFTGSTRLSVSTTGGMFLGDIEVNPTIGVGVETPPEDTLVVNLSSLLAGQDDVRLEFRLEGEGYFWILDDIELTTTQPLPQTTPAGPGDYLRNNGYPFDVSPEGTAYVPDQIAVQFTFGTDPAYRDSIREAYGGMLLQSCACGDLELWKVDGSLFGNDDSTRDDFGGTTGILSGGIGTNRPNMVDGTDRNYYNITEPYLPLPNPINEPLDSNALQFLPNRRQDAIRIAILDTGIDYNHPFVRDFLALGPDRVFPRGIDDDDNGLVDDLLGWNFADDNNNAFDNNDHGTHVAGIIADYLREAEAELCDYEFIPYKTHDANGVSTLFDVACATFQASKDGVNFINDSWGFFGNSSEILANAIDTAGVNDILVITAAGNDTVDLAVMPQYPACYPATNIVNVGALQPDGNVRGARYSEPAWFTNFDPDCVDVMAPGRYINSSVPGNRYDEKDGTSMAAPFVTAYFAQQYCLLLDSLGVDRLDSIQVLRDYGLGKVGTRPFYSNAVDQGRFLGVVVSATDRQPARNAFTAYPVPFDRQLTLTARYPVGRAMVEIFDAGGRVVYRRANVGWVAADANRTFELPSLPSGSYLLRVSGTDFVWTTPLVRQ